MASLTGTPLAVRARRCAENSSPGLELEGKSHGLGVRRDLIAGTRSDYASRERNSEPESVAVLIRKGPGTMQPDESFYRKPRDIPVRISSGGVVTRVENGNILIALTREVQLTDYVLPKGGVQEGETLEGAARREILEEAGLAELRLMEKLGIGEHLNIEKTRWIRAHYFLFLTGQVSARPTDTDNHFGVGWFPLDGLPPMSWRDQRELIVSGRDRIQELVTSHGERNRGING